MRFEHLVTHARNVATSDPAGAVHDAVFSRVGRTIATSGSDGTVRLWDAASSAPPVVLRGHTAPVISVAFSSDGAALISGAHDATARVWALDTLTT